MLEGLVQHDFPLTIQYILGRMRTVNGAGTVTTLRAPGSLTTATYAEVGARCDKVAHALRELGVEQSDRVGTFMWNSQEHFEVYMAAPCYGAVLHTLNLRLFPEQLTYIVNHARDKVIFVDDSVAPLLARVAGDLETVAAFVVVGDGDVDLPGTVIRYDELLGRQPDTPFQWPALDDHTAAGLCYTSGTTGNPKGVLYSHKSNVLHSVSISVPDALNLSGRDRMLPVVPMFHANAWGLPYAAALMGADLVMPSKFLQAEPLARLIEQERITVAGAVPTIWMDLLRYADEHKPDLTSLKIVPCGGAAVPRSLMEGFQQRHGVYIAQAWGMTEMSPLGSVAHAPRGVDEGEEHWGYRTRAGKLAPLVEARIVGADGSEQPWDGEATGELEVRGPWIASAYYEADSADKFHDGWLRTGDVAAISPNGYIRITDRAKDVIKSGGEWISSVDLENELMAHPSVREAAVISKPDERWTERPLACVVLDEGASLTGQELAEFLLDRVAKWWIPDEYAFIDEVPKTSVGKFDKKLLRARLADGELGETQSAALSGAAR